MPNKTCFVVMGFGTKTDYTKPKTFNLDKTYRNIIKPAALAAGFECMRADEIVHSGNINVPMYEQLLKADVVVADVSAYNCNAFYELGVRHALRPYTTIIISEDGLTFPFDVGQIAVRKYHHLGEGIDYDEVERMKKELSEAMKIISERQADDSPVYTFIKDLKPPILAVAEAIAAGAATLPVQALAAPAPAPGAANNPTLSILVQQAEKALKENKFSVAKALFADLHEKMPNDVSVMHKLALATYKARLPTEKEALEEASNLLAGLNPSQSTDTETLGLLQAVHKRLWNLTRDRSHLEKAIWSSEKGFYLKNDYYNGINLAYLYNVRASVSEGPDAVTDFVLAQRTRRRVVDICQALLDETKTKPGARAFDRDATYWVLATLAEAWAGLGDDAKSQEYQNQALALDPRPPQWMIDSTQEQVKGLQKLISDLLLKTGLNPAQTKPSGSK
jgi:tetratricopeptide (TPR) repeat protein